MKRKSDLPLFEQPEFPHSELSTRIPLDLKALSSHQTKDLIHELQVHQIELKMQNEELRRTHAELEASQARYFDLYDLAPVGYLTVDESGLILESNLVAATMFDVPKNTLIKQPLTRFIFKEDQDLYYKHRKQLFGTGGPQTLELRMLKKDGSPFWTRLDSTIAQNTDGMAVCRVVVSDITDRKRAEEKQKKLEEQLRQSQKLEAIGQLSSGVAHDFNNLLGGIMGNAEILKMNLDPESSLMRHPDVIISLCEKASDLTRKLLSFARKAPVEFRKLDLNAFLKQVVGLMDRTIDRRIEIITSLADQAVFISGDRNQLENALLNIAINARDAMPEGGHLCLSLKIVDLNQAVLPDEHAEIMEGPYARITITDTGTGMSKEIKERIFEPFFTTKEVGKGTGLGLASVYGCVKQHNGYIAVQSQVGKGTQFDLYFPILTSAAGGPASVTTSEVLLRGKGTLLVVDDEQVYHEILTKIFNGLGYTVHCRANGAEGIEYYREHSPAIDVVILDMNMPKMNGLQCFRRFKEINPGVEVIISTGYGENSDRAALQKEGVCAFVQKPYKATELSTKILELVNGPHLR